MLYADIIINDSEIPLVKINSTELATALQMYAPPTDQSNYYDKTASDGKYQLISSMANYYNKNEVNAQLSNYALNSALINNYYDKNYINNEQNNFVLS